MTNMRRYSPILIVIIIALAMLGILGSCRGVTLTNRTQESFNRESILSNDDHEFRVEVGSLGGVVESSVKAFAIVDGVQHEMQGSGFDVWRYTSNKPCPGFEYSFDVTYDAENFVERLLGADGHAKIPSGEPYRAEVHYVHDAIWHSDKWAPSTEVEERIYFIGDINTPDDGWITEVGVRNCNPGKENVTIENVEIMAYSNFPGDWIFFHLLDIGTLPVTLEYGDQYTFGLRFAENYDRRRAPLIIAIEGVPNHVIQLDGHKFRDG